MISARALLDDVLGAFTLLTRLPLPRREEKALARGVWAYPLVGAGVGALSAGAWFAGQFAGLGLPLSAELALGTQILITGALHEDGLADFTDGMGGRDKYAALSIMHDSRIGAFGVIALVMVLGLRWAAMSELALHVVLAGLICSALLGRLAMVALLAWLAPARSGGMGAMVANPPRASVIAALVIAVALVIVQLAPVAAALAFTALGVSVWYVARAAKRKVGGYTGDVLGAGEQLAQTAVLLVLAGTA